MLVLPLLWSRLEVTATDCWTVKAEVVMPLLAKRALTSSELVSATEHTGKLEEDSTFSASFWA